MTSRDNRFAGKFTRVSISGFRSLKSLENLELPQLTVLIGANGAGKSNFIRFFEMLGWMLRSAKLQEFVLREGSGDDQFYMGARKSPKIHAEIRIETPKGFNDFRFDLTHLSAGDRVLVSNEAYRFSDKEENTQARWTELREASLESQISSQPNPTARAITHLLRQCTTYQFHDTSEHADIRKRWDTSDYANLRSDGGNLAAVLFNLLSHDLPRYQQLLLQIQRVLPGFECFVLEPVAGKIELRWKGKFSEKIFGPHLTSDGSIRLFCLLTLLSLPRNQLPDVLFFDEPELGLHPHAITLVAQMLKRVSQSCQVFIATQSPYLVDCFELENIIVAETKEGATLLRSLPREEYNQWLEDDYLLSEIWLKMPVGSTS